MDIVAQAIAADHGGEYLKAQMLYNRAADQLLIGKIDLRSVAVE
jgi:hypothetical protein